MGIYGHSFDNLKVTNEGFKFFDKFKNKAKKLKKSLSKVSTPKYDIKKIEEKFKSAYKLTPELIDSGFNIFSVVKTKEDFDKVVKATGNSLNDDVKKMVFYTYCYQYDFPDNDPNKIDELIKIINDTEKNDPYKEGAVQILTFAKQNKLIPIEYDTDSVFYNISDKKFYSMDYKGRTGGLGTIKDMLDEQEFNVD